AARLRGAPAGHPGHRDHARAAAAHAGRQQLVAGGGLVRRHHGRLRAGLRGAVPPPHRMNAWRPVACDAEPPAAACTVLHYRANVSYPADRARRTTLAGRLARLGFADAARAERLVVELRLDDELIGALGDAADPDLALTGLARLLPSGDGAAAGLRPALQ